MSYLTRNAKRAKLDTFESRHGTERGPVTTAQNTLNTLEVLQAFCEVNSIDCEYASEYGEPGYTAPAKGILFADWNCVPKSLQTRLETQGYELEWSDEWYIDSDNSKAWRTQADSHWWEPRVRYCDGYVLTADDDPQEWIDACENDSMGPLPSWFDLDALTAAHFTERDKTYATGFHPWQNDSPAKIVETIRVKGHDCVLQVTGRGQFDTRWRVWVKRRKAKRELFLSDAHGRYLPRDFAHCIRRDTLTGVDMDELDRLLDEDSPDSEDYWDIWRDVLDHAEVTDDNGVTWTFYQDGGLWMLEKGAEFDESEDEYFIP